MEHFKINHKIEIATEEENIKIHLHVKVKTKMEEINSEKASSKAKI